MNNITLKIHTLFGRFINLATQINPVKKNLHNTYSVDSDMIEMESQKLSNDKQKKPTSVARMNVLEAKVEGIESSISNIESLSANIMSMLQKVDSTTESATVVSPVSVEKAPEVFNYQTSAKSNESLSRIVPTNIEKGEERKIGIYDILSACMKEGKVTISAPHIKKDGTQGKSYILNMPRIDENFLLVHKEGTTKAEQLAESKQLWKTVAYSPSTFTGRYFSKEEGKGVFTTYIKSKTEAPLLKWLEQQGVHIPKRN